MLRELLSKQSGVTIANLDWLAATASKRYKTYEIPKRSGGMRTIHHPSRSLKGVQRWISKFLFARLPVHDAACAYVRGSGIRKNAEAHVHSSFTLRLDFTDFFPCFSQLHVEKFLYQLQPGIDLNLTDDDVAFVSRIASRHGHLTIGAPSSPSLTNAMMFAFDSKVSEFAASRNLIYTRYADDLFFSSQQPNNLSDVYHFVTGIAEVYPFAKLKLNPEKTAFLSRRYVRRVTGLVLTTEGKVSIGRDRKRMIKAQVHKFLGGELEHETISSLCGYLAFIQDVEPDFWLSLQRKYGENAMEQLLPGQR